MSEWLHAVRAFFRPYGQTSGQLGPKPGIEHSALFVALSPCELYERKVTMQELHAAIASLPDKQAKRVSTLISFSA